MSEENDTGTDSSASEVSIFEDPKAFHAALKETAEGEGAGDDVAAASEADEVGEEGTPDVEDDDEDEEEEGDTASGHAIPKKRFDKERLKRKALELEREEMHTENIRLQTELASINNALKQYFKEGDQGGGEGGDATEDEFEPLDPEAKRYFDKKLQAIEKKNEDLLKRLEDKEKKDGDTQALSAYTAELKAHQDAFMEKNPDFMIAYQHLLKAKHAEYMELGYKDEEAQTEVIKELGYKARRAHDAGKNVAQAAYAMAKSYGYKKGEGRGDNLDVLKKNMKKSSSVSSVPAAVTNGSGVEIKQIMEKIAKGPGDYSDPKKFHALLQQQRSIQRG